MDGEPNPVAEALVRPLFALPAWLAGLINAVPDWVIAGTFLVTWVRPSALGEDMVDRLELVMLMEFVVVHSTGFMGAVALSRADRRAKLIGLLALGGFYSIFTGGFSMGFHTIWPFLAFWALTANRMLGVLISPAADLREAKVLAAGRAAAGRAPRRRPPRSEGPRGGLGVGGARLRLHGDGHDAAPDAPARAHPEGRVLPPPHRKRSLGRPAVAGPGGWHPPLPR